MTIEELKAKEKVLREDFKSVLAELDTDGENTIEFIKSLKTYGALWHYTNQLIKAETETKQHI